MRKNKQTKTSIPKQAVVLKCSCREHESKSLSWPFQKRTSYMPGFMAMFILQTQWLLDSFDHIQKDQLIKIMHLYMKKQGSSLPLSLRVDFNQNVTTVKYRSPSHTAGIYFLFCSINTSYTCEKWLVKISLKQKSRERKIFPGNWQTFSNK